jgi:hypothetical protein
MRRALVTDHGDGSTPKRKGMIEPVLVRSEWRLITATHTLLKLWRHKGALALG